MSPTPNGSTTAGNQCLVRCAPTQENRPNQPAPDHMPTGLEHHGLRTKGVCQKRFVRRTCVQKGIVPLKDRNTLQMAQAERIKARPTAPVAQICLFTGARNTVQALRASQTANPIFQHPEAPQPALACGKVLASTTQTVSAFCMPKAPAVNPPRNTLVTPANTRTSTTRHKVSFSWMHRLNTMLSSS